MQDEDNSRSSTFSITDEKLHVRIGLLFARLGSDFEFTTDSQKITDAFYHLSKEEKYSTLLDGLNFREYDNKGQESLLCEGLNYIVDSLHFSTLLKSEEGKYITSKDLEKLYLKAELCEKDQHLISGASEKLKKHLSNYKK